MSTQSSLNAKPPVDPAKAKARIERQTLIIQRELAAAQLIDDAQIGRHTVEVMSGFRTTALYEKMRTKSFPQPIRRNSRCVRWRAGDVKAWLAEQAKAQAAS